MAKELVVRHWIDAPITAVWNAYITPEIFHRWFSPEGLSIPLESVVIEPFVGGRFECVMVFDDTGVESPNIGTVLEIDPPYKIVGGELVGEGFRSTWSLSEESGGTLITVVQIGLPDEVVDNPEVLSAFRSSYYKLGRVLNVNTEDRN